MKQLAYPILSDKSRVLGKIELLDDPQRDLVGPQELDLTFDRAHGLQRQFVSHRGLLKDLDLVRIDQQRRGRDKLRFRLQKENGGESRAEECQGKDQDDLPPYDTENVGDHFRGRGALRLERRHLRCEKVRPGFRV